jgi:hypothetical protein
MIVRFPDSLVIDITIATFMIPTAPATNTMKIYSIGGYNATVDWTYNAASIQEHASFIGQIQAGLANKIPYLDLLSFAGLPTITKTLVTDIFFDNQTQPAGTYAVTAGQVVLVTLGTSNGGGATTPVGPATPGANALTACFRPGARCYITDGVTVYQSPLVTYVDATRLLVTMPVVPTGHNYDFTYSDGRGSVTTTHADNRISF